MPAAFLTFLAALAAVAGRLGTPGPATGFTANELAQNGYAICSYGAVPCRDGYGFRGTFSGPVFWRGSGSGRYHPVKVAKDLEVIARRHAADIRATIAADRDGWGIPC